MSGFSSERTVKAVRKRCQCEQCYRWIEVGEPKVVLSGFWEGDFYSVSAHLECHEAARRYERESKWPTEEGYFILADDRGGDDDEWVRKHYPIVAERLGITPTHGDGAGGTAGEAR